MLLLKIIITTNILVLLPLVESQCQWCYLFLKIFCCCSILNSIFDKPLGKLFNIWRKHALFVYMLPWTSDVWTITIATFLYLGIVVEVNTFFKKWSTRIRISNSLITTPSKFDILKFKITLSVFISYFPPYECLFPTALTIVH